MPRRFVLVALILLPALAYGQFDPAGAHVNLYFPQLADGGPLIQQWQTTFVFVNPNPVAASVVLTIYGDDGQPLALNLGLGALSTHNFTIAPGGSQILRSRVVSQSVVTGWALATSNVPLQATVLYRAIEDSLHRVEISAAATLPTSIYRSPANVSLGIALANPSTAPIRVNVKAFDSNGDQAGSTVAAVGSLGHTSFNLSSVLPSLPAAFTGSVLLEADPPTQQFVAWTLNADRGLLSSLPPGPLSWPISHSDRISLVFSKLWNATRTIAQLSPTLSGFGTTIPELRIVTEIPGSFGSDRIQAQGGQNITITRGLSELISDSPSELAFVIGHAMGHVFQSRTGRQAFDSDAELDADSWAFILSTLAGFDPYGAAGALGKLAMATSGVRLTQQFEAQAAPDANRSFTARLNTLVDRITAACRIIPASCTQYRNVVHPNLPPVAPALAPRELLGVAVER